MNKIMVFGIGVLLLTGCSRKEFRAADYRVLCDAETNTAYYVEPGAGQTSFLRKSPQFDKLCNKGQP